MNRVHLKSLFLMGCFISAPSYAAIDCTSYPSWENVDWSDPSSIKPQPSEVWVDNNSAYQCHSDASGAWCSQESYRPSSIYGPSAWDLLDECLVNSAPSVTITAPAVVSNTSTIPLSAEAQSTSSTINHVQFSLLDSSMNTVWTTIDSDYPYSVIADAQPVGNYTARAIAIDDNDIASTPSDSLITVAKSSIQAKLTNPKDGSTYPENSDITLETTVVDLDDNDSVKSVEFYVNGEKVDTDSSAPYSYIYHAEQAGAYLISSNVITASNESIDAGDANIQIISNVSMSDIFTPYWTSWGTAAASMGELSDKTSSVNLAFAQMTSNFIVIGSDKLLQYSGEDTPETVSNVDPTYLNWTTRKNKNSETKMMLSLGGATYNSTWELLKDTDNIDDFVNALTDVVNQQYPVYEYQSGLYQKIGYVQLDGVDLDIESTGLESNTIWSQNIADVIVQFKQENPNKHITLTGMHTAGDPISCQTGGSFASGCSYPAGSPYAGGLTVVLENLKQSHSTDALTAYYVMGYDAGKQGIDYDWKVALNNISRYLPKEKIVLGVSIGSQWGPSGNFVESMGAITTKAQEQQSLGYGGVMVWAVGAWGDKTAPEQVQQMNQIADSFK